MVTPREDHVTAKARQMVEEGQENSFYIFDLQAVRNRVKMWRENLPDVAIYYSFKTNSDAELVKTMLDMGTNFDCASMGEISAAVALGVLPENILYANPCKPESHIVYARETGVRLMTFDSVEEAQKIHDVYPEAELILRITVDDRRAFTQMSNKFGAKEEQWSPILDTCKSLNMRVRGVSFHVGSGGCHFHEYRDSVGNAKRVFDLAKSKGMPAMDIVDIGGGFSMSSHEAERNFDHVAP